jgi:hypothetical protein
MALIEDPHVPPVDVARAPAPADTDESSARRALRRQISRLELELAGILVGGPRTREVVRHRPLHAPRGGHLLSVGELERRRDELAERVHEARRKLSERTTAQEQARVRLERMLLEPGRHKFERVPNAALGEGGCGVWEVRPRLGIIGMLAGWWEVRLSSGCPLATAGPPGRHPRAASVTRGRLQAAAVA